MARDDIQCGIGKLTKGKRLGSMKECAEKGQVKLYGLRKIDPKTMASIKAKKTIVAQRLTLMKKIVVVRVHIKKDTENIEFQKDKKKKAELMNKVKDNKKKLVELVEAYKQIEMALKN